MYYVGKIKDGSKSGRVLICKSKSVLSELTGIPESVLRYQFERAGNIYYEHDSPWVEIWLIDKITKQKRTGREMTQQWD